MADSRRCLLLLMATATASGFHMSALRGAPASVERRWCGGDRNGDTDLTVPLKVSQPCMKALHRARTTPAMVHSADELQLAAALVLPLLTYKVAAIVQRVQLQWYLDASIALATSALLVYAAS